MTVPPDDARPDEPPPTAGYPPTGPGYGYGHPPPGYPLHQPPGPAYPNVPAARTSGRAVAVLVLGIAGLVLTCGSGIGVVAAIVALCLAPGAYREVRESGGAVTGEGMVRAGVICSWVTVGLTVAGILLLVALVVGGVAAGA